MMELKKYKLGEIVDIFAGGDAPKEKMSFVKSAQFSIPIFSNGIENEGLYGYTDTARVFEQAITVSARGTIGVPFRRREPYFPIVRLISIVPRNIQVVNVDFLYYYIKNTPMVGEGSVQSQLTVPMVKEYNLSLPSLPEQKRIASILSALDKKIALNRQINQNLEALARQLYDYWFVQFDFPNEEGKPYKSSGGKMVYNPILKREIPEGWEVKNLGTQFDVINERISPNQLLKDDKYTPIEIIPRHQMSLSEYIPLEEATSGLCRYKKGDILLSNRRVYFHKVCIAPFDGITRDTVIVLRPNETKKLGYLFQVVFSEHFIKFATLNSYGSEQPVLSWTSAQNYKILIPQNNLDLIYSRKMACIIEQVVANNQQILSLTKQRDELLPLLMNGQVNFDLSGD